MAPSMYKAHPIFDCPLICTDLLYCIFRARAWAKYCWPNQDWTSVELLYSLHTSNKVLCGRHFNEKQFYDDRRQKLSKFAVPDSTVIETLLNERENVFNQVNITHNFYLY